MLLSGTASMSRRVGQDDVETVRTEQRGVYAGAMQSYMGDRVQQTYTASFRAVSDLQAVHPPRRRLRHRDP